MHKGQTTQLTIFFRSNQVERSTWDNLLQTSLFNMICSEKLLVSLNQVEQDITTAAKAFGKSHFSAAGDLHSDSILQTQEFFQAFAVQLT